MAAKKRSIFMIQQASTKSMPPMNMRLQRFWNPNSQGSNKRVLVRFWRWPVLLYLQQIPFKIITLPTWHHCQKASTHPAYNCQFFLSMQREPFSSHYAFISWKIHQDYLKWVQFIKGSINFLVGSGAS
ncbi:hypothetical protein AB3S75_034208 [Citrus x aurantiifolia]